MGKNQSKHKTKKKKKEHHLKNQKNQDKKGLNKPNKSNPEIISDQDQIMQQVPVSATVKDVNGNGVLQNGR